MLNLHHDWAAAGGANIMHVQGGASGRRSASTPIEGVGSKEIPREGDSSETIYSGV
jgi:hypothetical protein